MIASPTRYLLMLLSCAIVLSSCERDTLNKSEWLNPSNLTEAQSDIAKTFDNATVLLPGEQGQEPVATTMGATELDARLRRLPRGVGFPTVIYMHGCTGLKNFTLLKALAKNGFAVIAPNSFARRYRPLQCRASRRTGGENVFVYDFRLAEISYALHRMATLEWVDRNRLFLAGTSEGGVAAALYRGNDFRARVITQWTCQGASLVRGLAAPPEEPVLAIVRAKDPWYDPSRTPGQSGDCGAFMDGRPRSASIVINGGVRHNVFDTPGAIQRILDFLSEELRRSRADARSATERDNARLPQDGAVSSHHRHRS